MDGVCFCTIDRTVTFNTKSAQSQMEREDYPDFNNRNRTASVLQVLHIYTYNRESSAPYLG